MIHTDGGRPFPQTASGMVPYYQSDRAVLYCGSHEDVLHGTDLPDITTLISDPPWFGMAYAQRIALGLQEFNAVEEGQFLGHLMSWYASWLPRLRQLVDYAGGRAWFFTGPTHLATLIRMAHLSGWPLRRLFFAPESYALVQFGRPLPDGLALPIERVFSESGHPSRIDANILAAILATADAGAVLDPFMGMGGTIVASVQAQRYAVGIDVKEECCAMAKHRLERLA